MSIITIEFNSEKKVSSSEGLMKTYNVTVDGGKDDVNIKTALNTLTNIQANKLKPITKRFDEIINNRNLSRVLIIGDIHEPFSHDEYIEFCKYQYDKFNCNTVVFIGDVVDNHFSSFHPTDPDGFGAGEELERAIQRIQRWYKVFPKATVIIGNHDRLAYRKAFSGGVSRLWVRDYNEVLNTPNWNFVDNIVIDNVMYIHGEAGTATNKAKDSNMSIVQGHLHSQAYINWINNDKFAMQVGTGIDESKYAFAYNKAGKESITACGIILNGEQPFLIKM